MLKTCPYFLVVCCLVMSGCGKKWLQENPVDPLSMDEVNRVSQILNQVSPETSFSLQMYLLKNLLKTTISSQKINSLVEMGEKLENMLLKTVRSAKQQESQTHQAMGLEQMRITTLCANNGYIAKDILNRHLRKNLAPDEAPQIARMDLLDAPHLSIHQKNLEPDEGSTNPLPSISPVNEKSNWLSKKNDPPQKTQFDQELIQKNITAKMLSSLVNQSKIECTSVAVRKNLVNGLINYINARTGSKIVSWRF